MTEAKNNNGHHDNKIKLSAEQKKELSVISAGLNTNLIKIEQLLTQISATYNQTMVANNESFINAVHTLEETLNELEKITEPIKKLL